MPEQYSLSVCSFKVGKVKVSATGVVASEHQCKEGSVKILLQLKSKIHLGDLQAVDVKIDFAFCGIFKKI